MKYFRLQRHKPVACTMQEWFAWFMKNGGPTSLARDEVGPYLISTIFLGISTSILGEPRPFETMVFHAGGGVDQQRSSTWKQAMETHAAALKRWRPKKSKRSRAV